MKYFVYYSASGNGDFIASKLEEKGYQPVKVEMVKPIKKVGFFTILKYGFRAGSGKKENIKEINIEFKEDDEIIIGSPVWNGSLSTPINTVLDKYSFNKDTTRFIVYPAGDEAKKVAKQLQNLGYKNEPIIYPHPLKDPDKLEELLK